MDNLTHTLLGVTLANAGLSKRFGKGTLFTLATASNLPDIDVFWAGLHNSELFLLQRRMLTHSVFGVPVLAVIAAILLRLYYKNLSLKALFGLCLLGMGLHVFFDLFNSYGVVLLYPLSMKRFELSWVFIIDLVMWILLLAPLVISRIGRLLHKTRANLTLLSQASLLLVSAYVGLCAYGHAQALNILNETIAHNGARPELKYVFPEALGPHRFRAITKESNEYKLYLVNWPGHKIELKKTYHTDENLPQVLAVRQTKTARQLEWFFKAPVWKYNPENNEADVFDIRFQSLVVTWRKAPFAFHFKIDKGLKTSN